MLANRRITLIHLFHRVAAKSQEVFEKWRMVPAPERGEIVRQIGLALREHKSDLGKLVAYEMGRPR